MNGDSVEPWDPSSAKDIEACERKLEFSIAWFADPIYFGQYPPSETLWSTLESEIAKTITNRLQGMRQQLGSRLPSFSAEEQALVQGSNDAYFMVSLKEYVLR